MMFEKVPFSTRATLTVGAENRSFSIPANDLRVMHTEEDGYTAINVSVEIDPRHLPEFGSLSGEDEMMRAENKALTADLKLSRDMVMTERHAYSRLFEEFTSEIVSVNRELSEAFAELDAALEDNLELSEAYSDNVSVSAMRELEEELVVMMTENESLIDEVEELSGGLKRCADRNIAASEANYAEQEMLGYELQKAELEVERLKKQVAKMRPTLSRMKDDPQFKGM